MKKLILVVALALSTVTFAQGKREKRATLTPAQQTELQVKKMTLDLDLDAQQQKELKPLLLDQANKRAAKMAEMKTKKEKGEPLTADEKFALKNGMLDHQLEQKAQMKKILKPAQFQKWEAKQENRSAKMSNKKQQGKEKRKGASKNEA